MRQVMVAGNWKMNGSSDSVKELMAGIKEGMASVTKAEVVVCPPAVYIPRVSGAADGTAIKVGSQNVCDQDSGAFTGEISADMLKDVGCEYAIIGQIYEPPYQYHYLKRPYTLEPLTATGMPVIHSLVENGNRLDDEFFDLNFDFTGWKVPVHRLFGTCNDLAGNGNDTFIANRFRGIKDGVGRFDNALGQAVIVPYIDKKQAAMVALAMNPA